jgi:hypothetical protein
MGAKKSSRLPNNSKRLWEQRNRPVYQIIQKDYMGAKKPSRFFFGLNTWNGYHLTHGKKEVSC